MELVFEEIVIVEHNVRARLASVQARMDDASNSACAHASMSLATESRRLLHAECTRAKDDLERMDRFVRLVDCMLVQRLRQIGLQTLQDDWIATLTQRSGRNGLLLVNFVRLPSPSLPPPILPAPFHAISPSVLSRRNGVAITRFRACPLAAVCLSPSC